MDCEGQTYDLPTKSDAMPELTKAQPGILVVDDNQELLGGLSSWLRSVFAEFHIIEARDGEAALAVVRGEAPSLVLIDVSMPGMGGLAACREMKALLPGLPVVMMSLYEGRHYREQSVEYGAQAYINKREIFHTLIPVMKDLLYPKDGKRNQNSDAQPQGEECGA
jgi:CheY-like chemotaxis protein